MKFSEFGVKNPVTTSMIFIAIVVLGAFAYTLVGIDLMPKFDVPVVMVVTQYQGAGPQEVEQRVTELIEARVSSVENVDEDGDSAYDEGEGYYVKYTYYIKSSSTLPIRSTSSRFVNAVVPPAAVVFTAPVILPYS